MPVHQSVIKVNKIWRIFLASALPELHCACAFNVLYIRADGPNLSRALPIDTELAHTFCFTKRKRK
jgi:hypothetical protein